jgi:hypothetical protein
MKQRPAIPAGLFAFKETHMVPTLVGLLVKELLTIWLGEDDDD